MLYRIYALYQSRKWIVAGVGLLLLVQTTVNAWLMTHGERVYAPADFCSNHIIFVVFIAVQHNDSSGVHGKSIVGLFAAWFMNFEVSMHDDILPTCVRTFFL